jgi:hypothetical protein
VAVDGEQAVRVDCGRGEPLTSGRTGSGMPARRSVRSCLPGCSTRVRGRSALGRLRQGGTARPLRSATSTRPVRGARSSTRPIGSPSTAWRSSASSRRTMTGRSCSSCRKVATAEAAAKQLNAAVAYAWEHEWDAQLALAQARLYTLDLGVSALRCRWDPTQGPPAGEVPMHPVTGEPVTHPAELRVALDNGTLTDGSLPVLQADAGGANVLGGVQLVRDPRAARLQPRGQRSRGRCSSGPSRSTH